MKYFDDQYTEQELAPEVEQAFRKVIPNFQTVAGGPDSTGKQFYRTTDAKLGSINVKELMERALDKEEVVEVAVAANVKPNEVPFVILPETFGEPVHYVQYVPVNNVS